MEKRSVYSGGGGRMTAKRMETRIIIRKKESENYASRAKRERERERERESEKESVQQ
jgi:hypothetical protein